MSECGENCTECQAPFGFHAMGCSLLANGGRVYGSGRLTFRCNSCEGVNGKHAPTCSRKSEVFEESSHIQCGKCGHRYDEHNNGLLSSDIWRCSIMPCVCPGFVSEMEAVELKPAEHVVHPAHYNSGKIEVWDFIVDQGLTYCLGDAVKYITRCGKKDPEKSIQDLEKSKQYIDREIRRIKEELLEAQILEANKKAFVDFGHAEFRLP